MRFISTLAHGITDYLVGAFLILTPSVFGFEEFGGAATVLPTVIGCAILIQALVSDFEVALFRLLPMRHHLRNDMLLGVVLAASPFLFGFITEPVNIWLPHLLIGAGIVFMALCTQQAPSAYPYTVSNEEERQQRSDAERRKVLR